MKRTLFLLALFFFAWMALPLSAQDNDVRLSMSFNNESLAQVLLRLEQSSSYKFLFTYDDVNRFKVKGSLKNAKFFDVINYVLRDKPLDYSVDGKFINITLQSSNRQHNDSRKIQTCGGYVFDAKTKEPIIGAQVKIPNTNIITVTDINGAFHFEYFLSGDQIVQVSYVGMKTITIPLQRIMRIMLHEDTKTLNDVVVTGIFRKAKESYTGSVSSISSEQLQQFRGQNLLQTLKNVDASINFSINNIQGSNPNNIPSINIRGNSSLPMSVEQFNQGSKSNPNTPLIIMDGFEISLTKLMDYNDEEIESINILKDAAATSIYGSRGANGVIVVVSKQPTEGQLKVNFEAGIQMELPDLSSYHLLNATQKLELERRAGLYDKGYSISNQSELLYKQAYEQRYHDVLSGINTDWLSKPLRTGVGQRYNLRLDGGSKEFRWAVDAQYNDVEGAMKGSSRKTFNGGITLLYKYKDLTFRNYSSIGVNNSHESPYGSFSDYVKQEPYNSPYDTYGNVRKFFDPFYAWSSSLENPLYNASLGSFNKTGYQELTNNFSVDWNILPELTLRGQLGISSTENTSDFFRSPEDTYYTNSTTGVEYSTGSGFLRRGLYRYGNGKTLSYNADMTLSYNKVFNDVHSLYLGLNWSMLETNTDNFLIALEGFSNEDLSNIPNARQYSADEMPSGSNYKTRQLGLTGNINYTYASRYYIDFSYRIDGNSSYGSNKKYAPFWSCGVGWNIHNEKFLKGNNIVNMLRLKASYGETGAASGALETDAYTYYSYVTDNRYMDWTGAVLGGFGNSNLSWQTTKEINVGTEFGLFDNRIKGTFEVYQKNTSNLLSSMDQPLSMGFDSYRANIGEVKNSGWEAALQGYAIRDSRRKINLMIGAQLVYNKNKITKLSQAIKDQTAAYLLKDATDDDASGIQSLFYEGRPQNSIYAVRSLGIDPSTGQEIYLDKDGKITDTWKASDKVYCGSATPLYRGNANVMFQWHDFTLNASFGYYWGGKTYNSTLRDRVEVTLNDLTQENVDERVLNSRWYQAGDVVFFKKLSNINTKASSRYVMDDNVLELQSVSLQYKLKSNYLLRAFKLNSMIFGLNLNDLVHWGSIKMERGTSYPYAHNVQASIKLLF
ncbi:SusC/RagA family TonB-linked outer membrane protein [Xylanibacter oryzae]|uniref:SusC/RagA family TonB-linked outer membrane protein n=1 Tax=Xylanibacter oryzae TaxID=185293 RepID=UPI0004BB3909|nr:SusC/RagA family TonB-linked outer membrane protein [Xylanibacter oryzae]